MISNSPSPPDRQLLTANLTALCPRHFVAVTYILRVALTAALSFAPPSSADENGDFEEPRNSTMFIGTTASGVWASIASEEGLRSSYDSESRMKVAISRAKVIFRVMISNHQLIQDGGSEHTAISIFTQTYQTSK
jgi:hypothetical protein